MKPGEKNIQYNKTNNTQLRGWQSRLLSREIHCQPCVIYIVPQHLFIKQLLNVFFLTSHNYLNLFNKYPTNYNINIYIYIINMSFHPPVFSRVRGTRSLVVCVCFVDRICPYVLFWPQCCLFFFDLRILITPLVSLILTLLAVNYDTFNFI